MEICGRQAIIINSVGRQVMVLLLEDMEVYRVAENLSDVVWKICSSWEYFPKETVGKQLTRAADSIGANIAEGFGRYSFKERIRYCHYARGSFMETRHFLRRAKQRQLLKPGEEEQLRPILARMGPLLNGYTNSLKRNMSEGVRNAD
jgi:four helix bundle protein